MKAPSQTLLNGASIYADLDIDPQRFDIEQLHAGHMASNQHVMVTQQYDFTNLLLLQLRLVYFR
jgi:hypothetical protein